VGAVAPQFQWEPVINLPNPNAGLYPPTLASADGGPTVLGTASVTLVPPPRKSSRR
jgi:hypothetical protein